MQVIFILVVSQLIFQSTASDSLSILDVFSRNMSRDEVVKYMNERAQSPLAPLMEAKPSIEDQYLVKFKNANSMDNVLSKIKTGKIAFDPSFLILHTFPLISVINVRMSPVTLLLFRKFSEVEFIETDGIMTMATCTTQPDAKFCLARSSNPSVTNKDYTYPNLAGKDVTVHVLDTGCMINHTDFGGRASNGMNFVPTEGSEDRQGHGTVCASLVMGNNCGTAKLAKVVSVKVLDERGNGNTGTIVTAMTWVAQNNRNAIISMSLGGPKSSTMNMAVDNLSINFGSFFIVAAGNSHADAANTSPASADRAFTVAASDSNNNLASFSNYGSVVDIIAPGVDCYSANFKGGYLTISGTSMATPLVAGLAAILRSANPSYTNEQLRNKIIQYAVNGTIKGLPSSTVNRFINVRCPLPAGVKITKSGRK